MQVILMERISRLGNVGETVKVRDGYARNYLIPTRKALRASNENLEFFESQRESLEKQNAERRVEAQKHAKTLEGVVATVVRQASDDGKLYGSVSVRDIAEALEREGHKLDRRLIDLNAAIKSLGVYTATVNLHPEVPVDIKVHVARNLDSPLPDELKEEEVVVEAAAPAEGELTADDDAADADDSSDTDA